MKKFATWLLIGAMAITLTACGSEPAGAEKEMGETTSEEASSAEAFPAFEGQDLDGNAVNSADLFSGNAVTVVNFWFTTCGPCVNELGELDALNQELQEKGGELVGVNVFTLDGDETAVAEAKETLAAKEATYQNIRFASDSEAGEMAMSLMAFPTTYVVDRDGNVVGEPVMGAITSPQQMAALESLIDEALEKDEKAGDTEQ